MLVSGNKNLYLWPTSHDTFENLCMTQTTGFIFIIIFRKIKFKFEFTELKGQNPNLDSITLEVDFPNYVQNANIFYPSMDEIGKLFKLNPDKLNDEVKILSRMVLVILSLKLVFKCFDCVGALENDNCLLMNILNKDALAELTEQDKTVLWKRKYFIFN